MRILITGRGSIAQRHAGWLRTLRPDAQLVVVSAHEEVAAALQPCRVVKDFAAGLATQPDGIVIASVSDRHAAELLEALRLRLPCLVEKPLVTNRDELARLRSGVAAIPAGAQPAVAVGCNLRQLPGLGRLRDLLRSARVGRLVRAHLEVGQDLRQWRPGRDLQASYSADAARGGGVVFDLVHEIDMASWLLGPLQVKAAIGGRLGGLLEKADDVHVGLLRAASGHPVTISLDYVSRRPVRRYVFVGTEATVTCDVIGKSLVLADPGGSQELAVEGDFDVAATYRTQMAQWLGAWQADPAGSVASPLSDAFETSELMLALLEEGR